MRAGIRELESEPLFFGGLVMAETVPGRRPAPVQSAQTDLRSATRSAFNPRLLRSIGAFHRHLPMQSSSVVQQFDASADLSKAMNGRRTAHHHLGEVEAEK